MVKAREAARKAIESTYEGICSIVEYGDILDEQTKITSQGEVTVLENQPCRLSFETISAVSQTDTAANVSQKTKLFLSPEITCAHKPPAQNKYGGVVSMEYRL